MYKLALMEKKETQIMFSYFYDSKEGKLALELEKPPKLLVTQAVTLI